MLGEVEGQDSRKRAMARARRERAAECDELFETNLRFRQRDFEVITVAAEPPAMKDKALAFLQKDHASTRNLIWGDSDKYKMIEALDPAWKGALPYTLVIDPNG